DKGAEAPGGGVPRERLAGLVCHGQRRVGEMAGAAPVARRRTISILNWRLTCSHPAEESPLALEGVPQLARVPPAVARILGHAPLDRRDNIARSAGREPRERWGSFVQMFCRDFLERHADERQATRQHQKAQYTQPVNVAPAIEVHLAHG